MNIWKENLMSCDAQDGLVFVITEDKKLHLCEEHHDWHMGTCIDAKTGEEYSDEVCDSWLVDICSEDDIQYDEVIRWCYITDLYLLFPPELAFEGSPRLGYVVTYKHAGKEERRIFYESDDVSGFLREIEGLPGYEIPDKYLAVYYMDRCEE
jgi:hypothetical protein